VEVYVSPKRETVLWEAKETPTWVRGESEYDTFIVALPEVALGTGEVPAFEPG